MEEVESIIDKLETIKQFYGIGGLLIFLFVVIGGIISWKFIVKRIEKLAEEITETNLKKVQSVMDKELVKYSVKHQKQIDAVQDCYQSFQQFQNLVNFIVNGDKFTEQMQPADEIKYLSTYRLEFKGSYNRNKILFPQGLNQKIESLFPEIDTFIEDYIGGLMPAVSNENSPEEYRNDYQIIGMWSTGILEPTLEKMDDISKAIEYEFRRIYGTDEK